MSFPTIFFLLSCDFLISFDFNFFFKLSYFRNIAFKSVRSPQYFILGFITVLHVSFIFK